ncbi:folate-binding protein YgfZ [Microbacterium awajiense]|uniref:Folate-binding protein YgfZ n=1 Tax=Microbacterium awajiense TaxID=415214 RepID=A0ABP7B0Z3_9MICO
MSARSLVGIDGAVIEDGVLRHAGNPLVEQRALAAGTAIAVLGDRGVVTVTGDDRLSWLDSLTSQALAALPPDVGTELLVLDPQGRIEHAASVVDDGTTTWLIVDRDDVEPLAGWLTKMRFRLRVDVAVRDDLVVVGGTPDALAVVGAAAPLWVDPWPSVTAGGHAYGPIEGHPGSDRAWAEAVVELVELDRLVAAQASGLALAGVDAADALRVAAWRPRWSTEVDDRAIPHEADWLRTAVHLSKGCYRGQETVAKVHNLGHPPRRLIALHLDGSESVLPVRGAEVRAGETVVGSVTSTALHYEDGPIALALVRRGAPVEGEVTVATEAGPVAAAQEVIVPPEAGATAGVPRMSRLSRRPRAT